MFYDVYSMKKLDIMLRHNSLLTDKIQMGNKIQMENASKYFKTYCYLPSFKLSTP